MMSKVWPSSVTVRSVALVVNWPLFVVLLISTIASVTARRPATSVAVNRKR
jgi:hypothetical protein